MPQINKLKRMVLATEKLDVDLNCPAIEWVDWGNYWGCRLQEKDCSGNYCSDLFPSEKGKTKIFLPCDCNNYLVCSRYKIF